MWKTPSLLVLLFIAACATATRGTSFDTLEQLAGKGSRTDLRSFWEELQIPPGVFADAYPLWRASSTFEDIDGDNTPERILKLRDADDFGRFLILKRLGDDWRMVGNVDTLFFTEPEARLVSNGRGRWLAINHMDAVWTPGSASEHENWYELTDGGLKQVLSFPMNGTVTIVPFDGSHDRVEIEYLNSRRVSFSKTPSDTIFEFDESHSSISRSEFFTTVVR